MIEADERNYLRDFFGALADRALDPGDEHYVRIYDLEELAVDDPVELLARGVEWTPGQSVQLLSGFRGTGKSTELRRLKRRLEDEGYPVVLCDLEEYINLSTPVEVSDFLMAVAGAFSDALAAPDLLGEELRGESYWERLATFLGRTEVDLDELAAEPAGVGLKATLKSDPTFKQRLQRRMAGHLGTLVRDVHEFIRDGARRLRDHRESEAEPVLLVDSAEKIRGTSSNAEEVHSSVEILFAGHADKLHLPGVHAVYTVPPYLKAKYQNAGALYDPGGIQVLPAVKVRALEEQEPFQPGLDALERVVARRGDWERLLGSRDRLDRLALASGGHLRDLLRLLVEVVRRARELPVRESTVDAALDQIRNEFLPIAQRDARWLARVAATHRAVLEDTSRLPDLARFLDTHMVLCYHNGREWYDVHPLIAAEVEAQLEGESREPVPNPKGD